MTVRKGDVKPVPSSMIDRILFLIGWIICITMNFIVVQRMNTYWFNYTLGVVEKNWFCFFLVQPRVFTFVFCFFFYCTTYRSLTFFLYLNESFIARTPSVLCFSLGLKVLLMRRHRLMRFECVCSALIALQALIYLGNSYVHRVGIGDEATREKFVLFSTFTVLNFHLL